MNTVNWNAISAISGLVGSLGVIATLLYLAKQVRYSTREAAVHSKLESARLLNDFIDRLIESPDLNQIWLRGRKDITALSHEEFIQFSNLCLKGFWLLSASHYQFRHGSLQGEDWFEALAIVRFLLHGAGYRAWWKNTGHHMFGKEFTAMIESEISRVGTV